MLSLGQSVQVVGFGQSFTIFPAVPGVGDVKGICALTSKPLRFVFFLKPVISCES